MSASAQQRGALTNRLHVAVALGSVWLIATSPWVSMLRRMPTHPGLLDYGHVVVGGLCLPIAVAYFAACVRGGRWRLYFPWASGRLGVVTADLAGLARGRIPASEGGGLFAVIEGLLLLALLFVAASGAAWFVLQGSAAAVAWRSYHIAGADVFIGLLVAHVVGVSLHLLDFIRN